MEIVKSFSRIFVKIKTKKVQVDVQSLSIFVKKYNVDKIIELNNVTIKQGESTVLQDVTCSVHEAEFVYIIGKTGSGKSSLLKALYGELPLDEGEGQVAGYNLKSLKRKEIPFLRRKMGIVFQDFQLLMDRTVLQNLYFVLKATGWKNRTEIHSRAMSVLQLVGIEQKADQMPNRLSGGEQQRVCIARALLNDPKIILADEPTGNLDVETSTEIMELLIALTKEENTAVLMATHDIQMVQKFPARTLHVENGKVQ
ncbi:MAG: ATP-binding cassette domain-containing protein [Flavobacteriia bacterium]|nr:ATP-binding cassette domain-containing protein [Flavobacteriia bacterium]